MAAGEVVLGTEVVPGLLSRLTSGRSHGTGTFPQLTEREAQILEAIAAGRNSRTIARELYLSEQTVRNNVSIIFTKLGVADRSMAIVKAREAGMGTG